jgi:hypothetical protein
MAMRRYSGIEGWWASPSFTDLVGEAWNIHFYIEFYSSFPIDYQCASAVLQKREIDGGSWASTGNQVELFSAGDGVWTSVDQEPFYHTGAPAGWEYRIWVRARIWNSTPMTQCVIRKLNLLANLAE